MVATKYCLNWNSYENNICKGLAKLQQCEEFVDMTLVADGHLVKVHKNLLALASPYLKQIIQTAPCQHPIIFFTNISHEILCYILEYIYTGETQVEVEKLQAFLTAAEELKLPNIANFLPSMTKQKVKNTETNEVPVDIEVLIQGEGDINKNCDADVPVLLDNQSYIEDTSDINSISDLIQINNTNNPVENEITIQVERETQELSNAENVNNPVVLTIDNPGVKPQQYTLSKRGSLQLILNRYIYSNHHQALQGRKRRWRCIDYRSQHCQAYIDTLDDNITKRKNIHTHPYHDSKIMKKIKANLIFESISTAAFTATKLNSLNNTEKMEDSE